jgi:hypothetical protein
VAVYVHSEIARFSSQESVQVDPLAHPKGTVGVVGTSRAAAWVGLEPWAVSIGASFRGREPRATISSKPQVVAVDKLDSPLIIIRYRYLHI